MRIVALEEISTIDYPNVPSAVVYTSGCSLRCPYCYNYEMVIDPESFTELEANEVFKKLIELKPFIDGVVITGGEPLIQSGLIVFVKALHRAGFKVKLDTNGMHPKELEALIPFVDFVAMDVKTNREMFKLFTSPEDGYERMIESSDIVKMKAKDYEFRVTMVKPFISLAAMTELTHYVLADSKKVALQRPLFDHVMYPEIEMSAPSEDEIEMYVYMLESSGVKTVIVR